MLGCWLGCGIVAAQEQKLKSEDVIARHLAALGSAEARAAAKHRLAMGQVTMVNRVGGSVNIQGEVNLITAGPKLRFAMRFPSNDYAYEDLAYDGDQLKTALLPQTGKRSNLAQFFNSQPLLVKEGLLGGALTMGWSFLHIEQLQPKLNYRGLKKINGRQLHELSYTARKGNDGMRIEMHFDPETFRHVRTNYHYEIGSRLQSSRNPDESASRQDSLFDLTESFDDFRLVEGLTLPHKYKLQLSVQTQNGSLLRDWSFEFDRISQQEIPDDQLFIIK